MFAPRTRWRDKPAINLLVPQDISSAGGAYRVPKGHIEEPLAVLSRATKSQRIRRRSHCARLDISRSARFDIRSQTRVRYMLVNSHSICSLRERDGILHAALARHIAPQAYRVLGHIAPVAAIHPFLAFPSRGRWRLRRMRCPPANQTDIIAEESRLHLICLASLNIFPSRGRLGTPLRRVLHPSRCARCNTSLRAAHVSPFLLALAPHHLTACGQHH